VPSVRDGYCRIRSARKIRQPSPRREPEPHANAPAPSSTKKGDHFLVALQRDERYNARSGCEENRVENRVQQRRLKGKTPVKLSRRRQNKVEYCNYFR